MKKLLPLLSASLLCLLTSCDKKADDTPYIERNTWVKEVMEEVYLWESELPADINPESTSNTFDFLTSLLYTDDYWTWVSDDYYATEDLYSGISTTAGFEFYLTYISDNYTVIGIVEYVLPSSPAAELGIKRGDIFTKIDNTTLNENNYYDLLTKGGTYSITLADFVNSTIVENNTVQLTEVEGFQEDPIFIDTVYQIEGKKIGYLMYNSFLYDYNDAKSLVFANFKAEGITDLILDLRYNLGGSVAAEEHLANLIAPQSALDEIFSIDHYNDLYTQYFNTVYGDDYANNRIESDANNINLTGQLIGLTTGSTASASEGVLNGLDPLLDLKLIGDTTYGKYTSLIVLPDDEDDPQWAIIPVFAKSTNKNNISVKGGMAPDILLDDNPLDGYQLGDIRETMLAKAIEEITGIAVTKSTRLTPIAKQPIARFKNGKKTEAIPRIINWGDDILIPD